MKRMQIKKLIVVSTSEKDSLEVEFDEGLNIIIGKNKTGKSSTIKSIFYALGCELSRIESEWKNLISDYLVYFIVENQEYCVYRNGKMFRMCHVDNEHYKLLISTDSFHEYSNELMNILDVKLPCINIKNQKQFNATPPLLFRLQYIDQDAGWSKIGDQFSNIKYISNWKSFSNKYTVGYYNNDYFELKNILELEKQDKVDFERKSIANQEFVKRIQEMIPCKIDESITVEDEAQNLIEKINILSEDILKLQERIGGIINSEHIIERKIELLKFNREESEKDIQFAKELESNVVCPTCGAVHENALSDQMLLVLDIASVDNLIEMLNKEKMQYIEDRIIIGIDLKKKNNELRELRKELIKVKNIARYEDTLKSEGKNEFYESCLKELDRLTSEINKKITEIAIKEEKLKKMNSTKRRNELRKELISYCSKVATTINISSNFIKLNDFVQTVNKTGSEGPRLIYMYYVGLYLYNLDRGSSPFNILVIDTPNQQGQDVNNLQGIFDSLNLLQDKRGQAIIATERETGYEDVASKVIKLGETRKCLNKKHFDKHINIVKEIISKDIGEETTDDY